MLNTGLYAALCAILIVVLGLRVARYRHAHRIGVGDNGERDLIRRVRAHGNAVENAPLALLLLLLLELGQAAPLLIHAFGIAIVLGRVLHAIGISRSTGASVARFVGTFVTWTAMLLMAALLLWRYALAHALF
jgi:uncharacterized membrane protein YecN with MAPEG domain